MSKVTIYALHLGMGGVENYLISLANILSEENEVTLISTYKVGQSPFFNLSSKVNLIYLTNSEPSANLIKGCLKQFRFIKAIKLLLFNINLFIKRKKLNKQYIIQDDADIIITSRTFHNALVSKYASEKSIKIATEHNYHNDDMQYVESLENSLRNFDYLVPISKELTEYYGMRQINENIKVLNIPFYVDQQESYSSLNEYNFIYIGRLSPEKGVMDLLEVFKNICILESRAKLTIVGDGEMAPAMLEFVKVNDLMENVVFTGRLSKDKINTLLKKQTFMLLTSFTESFGIVLLEAMSFGVIPLVFDSARGAVEVLEGFDELVISERSVDEMANMSLTLYNDKDKLHDLSLMLISRSKDYSFYEMEKQWQEFIRSLVKNERCNK